MERNDERLRLNNLRISPLHLFKHPLDIDQRAARFLLERGRIGLLADERQDVVQQLEIVPREVNQRAFGGDFGGVHAPKSSTEPPSRQAPISLPPRSQVCCPPQELGNALVPATSLPSPSSPFGNLANLEIASCLPPSVASVASLRETFPLRVSVPPCETCLFN